MSKLFKLLTIVSFLTVSNVAYAFTSFFTPGGDTLSQVRMELWHYGVDNGPDPTALFGLGERVEQEIQKKKETSRPDWRTRYPEELVYPLMRMKTF